MNSGFFLLSEMSHLVFNCCLALDLLLQLLTVERFSQFTNAATLLHASRAMTFEERLINADHFRTSLIRSDRRDVRGQSFFPGSFQSDHHTLNRWCLFVYLNKICIFAPLFDMCVVTTLVHLYERSSNET